MLNKQKLQLLISLKRGLERELGVTIDDDLGQLEARLLRLVAVSEDPDLRELGEMLRAPRVYRGRTPAEDPAPGSASQPAPGGRRIKGYYRGNPVYE